MSIPRAAGVPDYTSAGSSKFIPELWSSKIVKNLYDTTIFGEIANTDYEGEIKGQGDKVIIRTTPEITVRKYSKGQPLVNERPEKPSIVLNIDQAEYFSCIEDDVDKVQADVGLLDTWSADAAKRLKIAIDTNLLGSMATGAQSASLLAANVGTTAGRVSGDIDLGAAGTPIGLTAANVLDYFVNLGVVLDEQNIDPENRWAVIPAWLGGLIKRSDLKDAALSGDGTSMLRNGRIGMVNNIALYVSNLIPSTMDGGNKAFYIFCGHKMGMTFATQMTEMESIRMESTFGSAVRGLQVYGFQIVEPKAIARLYAYKA